MGLFTIGYRVNGPRIGCQIGEIVGFGGLLATAPPEALGSIGVRIISSMILVSTNNWLAELRTLEKCQLQCRVPHQITNRRRRQPLLPDFGRMEKHWLVRNVADKNLNWMPPGI